MRVKSLQRALVATTAVVGVGVGVVGYRTWQSMRAVVRQQTPTDTPALEQVRITRVLVRRRVGHEHEEGEVLQEQHLGTTEAAPPAAAQEGGAAGASPSLVARAKQLPVALKAAIFGSLVAGFVALNAWAIPALVPKRALPAFDKLASARGVLCELRCGDGQLVAAAAAHFTEVHGFEHRAWLARLARRATRRLPNVHIHGAGSDWRSVAGRADCVVAAEGDAAIVVPLMKQGAVLLKV